MTVDKIWAAEQEGLKELVTLQDFVRWGASSFNKAQLYFGHGTDNAIDEALALVLHALNLPHQLPSEFMQCRLVHSEKQAIAAFFRRRILERIPAPYLTHEAWFAGLKFYVDQRVLIPRSPLAELIERQFSPWIEADDVTAILDIGTGSGCIAIACAHAFPGAVVDAIDISEQALAVANINVARFYMSENVTLHHSDLFTAIPHRQYDVIVSNPPYVPTGELVTLPPEYRHEPQLGLHSGTAGLDHVVRILKDAPQYLTPHGLLVCEVGNTEEILADRFPEVPFLWVDFERGGGGVFVLTNDDLLRHHFEFENYQALQD